MLISPTCWEFFGSSSWISMWPCGLKVLQGRISGQIQWSPSCLSWLFRIKGERDSAPGSLFLQALIVSLHPSSPSLHFGASGRLCAPRWLRGGALSSRAGAGRLWASGKPEMFPGALAFGKQRESYLTAQWMQAGLHFECCQLYCLSAPCQMTLTPEPSSHLLFLHPDCRQDNLE